MAKQTKVICGLLTVSAVLGTCVMGQAAENVNNPMNVEQIMTDNSGAAEFEEQNGTIDNTQQAADKKSSKKEAAKAPAPITIEGDELSFNDLTGNVYAKGKVSVKQNSATLLADDMRGNTKRTEVQIDGKANMTQPGVNLDGYATFYNYQTHTGNMSNVKGIVDYKKHVQGERIEILPEEYIIYNGTVTKCPAKNPDYNLKAKKIEIWPDKKMIAYNVQFLIKGRVIYSMPRYEVKIGTNNDDDKSAFPRIGYNSDDGFFIKQNFQVTLAKNITADADIGYSSKRNFKNEYQITNHDSNYDLFLRSGDYQNNDNDWIKKEIEFEYATGKRIAGSPWKYKFNAVYGKWIEDTKKSWHQDYTIYFGHDPINLTRSLKLYFGTGYEIVKESYDDSQINTMKYNAVLKKRINNKFNIYTGYHYTKNNSQNSLFNYNNATIAENWASGINYRFDSKNSITIKQSYNLATKSLADMYYIWHHNLHCWEMDVTYHKDYDGNDESTSVKFKMAHW